MRIPSTISILLLGLLLLGPIGCGDDDSPTNPAPVEDFPAPTTPDLAMANLQKAWEQRNLAEYSKLLDVEFQFFFDPSDNLDPYIGGPSWGLASELAAVEKMFSNQAGYDPVGEEVIPPIKAIEFETFEALDADWQTPPEDPLYEGTLRRRYAYSIFVTYQGNDSATRAYAESWFYVKPIGLTLESETLYGVKVWEDRMSSGGKSSEWVTWGSLKAGWGGTVLQ